MTSTGFVILIICFLQIIDLNAEFPSNSTDISTVEPRIRRRIKCKDNIGCKKWVKKGFCHSKPFDDATRAMLCPVACGFCDFKEKPFPFFKRNTNEKANPCQSFYEFTCGKLLKDFPAKTPEEKFGAVYDVMKRVGGIQEKAFLEKSTSLAVQKMQDYYHKCMDTKAIEAAKTTQIREHIKVRTNTDFGVFQRMGGCPMLDGPSWKPAAFDLTKALIELTRGAGYQMIFGINAYRPESSATVVPAMATPSVLHKDPMVYVVPTMGAKVDALRVYISEVMGFVGFDSKSTRTFKEIGDSVGRLIQFERMIALLMLKHGSFDHAHNPRENEVKEDRMKFNDLAKLVTVVRRPAECSDFQVNWDTYVRENPLFNDKLRSHFRSNPDLIITTAAMYKDLNQLMEQTDKGILADYLVTMYVVSHSDEMDDRFRSAAKRFVETLGFPTPPSSGRHQDCYEAATKHFEIVNDFVFIKKTVSQKTVNKATQMVEDLRASLLHMIRREPWMDSTTRARALDKIRKTKKTIGGISLTQNQNELDSLYSTLNWTPSESFVDVDVKVHIHDMQRNLMMMLGGPDAWTLNTLANGGTIEPNAFNAFTVNHIKINAGILQTPFFDEHLPAAVNYGSLGAVVGHEFTHGIDPNGAKFDELGLKKNWWDQETLQKFQSKAKCISDLYGSQTERQTGMKIDGEISVGENVADHGGIRAAYKAYKRHIRRRRDKHLPGYRKYTGKQIFFMSFAMFFCASTHKEFLTYKIKTDEHSPPQFRIDLTMANFPEFAKAFSCRPGTPMNPHKRCTVW